MNVPATVRPSGSDLSSDRIHQLPADHIVVMLDDQDTPAELAVEVLRNVFGMEEAQAIVTMLDVHTKGGACCGAFPYERAEAKRVAALSIADERGSPLKLEVTRK